MLSSQPVWAFARECYRHNPYGPLRVNVIVTRMGFVNVNVSLKC